MKKKISFAPLPKKLQKRVYAFSEPWEPSETTLKEVEVAGWQELSKEIPSLTELQERWEEVRQEETDLDLDLDQVYELDVEELPGDVGWPNGGVKVKSSVMPRRLVKSAKLKIY